MREPILRRGVLFVLVYHFAGYTRVIGPTAAGLLRMPYRVWAPADYGGAVLWICAYFGIGYGLGVAGLTLDSTDRYFRFVEWGLLVARGSSGCTTWCRRTRRRSASAWPGEQPEEEAAEELTAAT